MNICRLLFALSLLRGLVHAAEPTFDTWADAFAAEWMRGAPSAATTAQYFSGSEQDALDRQLTPITKKYRAARVALAQRGLAELARFDRTKLSPSQIGRAHVCT